MIPLSFVLAASATTTIGLEVRSLDVDPEIERSLVETLAVELASRGRPVERDCSKCGATVLLSIIGGITQASIELRFGARSSTLEVPLHAAERPHAWEGALVDGVLGAGVQAAPPPHEHHLRSIGWGFFAAALAAMTAAAISGGIALDAEHDLRAEPRFDGEIDPVKTRLEISRSISLVSVSIAGVALVAIPLVTLLE
jgi:hypothetical protein